MGLGRGIFTRRKERSTEGRQAEEKRKDTRRRGGHEEEDDGSEASSTVLGYSLPVSWGPRCTRTILFLFLFFVAHSLSFRGLDLLPLLNSFFLPSFFSTFLSPFYSFSCFLNSVTKPSSHLFQCSSRFSGSIVHCDSRFYAPSLALTLSLFFFSLISPPFLFYTFSSVYSGVEQSVWDSISPNHDPRAGTDSSLDDFSTAGEA